MKLLNKSLLSSDEYNEIQALLRKCMDSDNSHGYFFFDDDMNEYPDFKCYILAYESTNLVGIMSAFISDKSHCELYAYVHPDYRCRNIYTSMYKLIIKECRLFDILNICIVCEPHSAGEAVLAHYNISNYYAEYLMKYDCNLNFLPDIHKNSGFRGYSLSTENPELFELIYNNDVIGHCRLDYTDNCTTIYDVVIFERYRGKGHSNILIQMVTSFLVNISDSSIVLHVSGDNIRAVHTYTSNGFKILEEIRYYYDICDINL